MLIHLLRHGDALASPTLSDSERPLSGLGEQQATSVGLFLASFSVRLDAIVSSPLVRAIQTAKTVAGILKVREVKTSEYLIPGTRKEQLIGFLNQAKWNSVLLVGHEPHISQTISTLLSGEENVPVEIQKCTLGCLLASDPVRKGHCLLQWLLTVDQMDRLRQPASSH